MKRFILFIILFLSIGVTISGQTTRKVLFLGNSYTGVNNLPQLVKDVALSAGDTLIFDSRTPGGYTLEDHSTDATSQSKIMAGGWDYVILQEQSQRPITNTSKFKNAARQLNTSIRQHTACAVSLLYITWGRKNGDASNCAAFPEMCTYENMDSTLKHEYLDLASSLNVEVSPVSVVWRYLRQNHPGIELYQADESHPSAAGSYAAACCFYATIFKKDPTSITDNFSLNNTDAATIRNAAKTAVFDSLALWDYKKPPQSGFRYSTGPSVNEVLFSPVHHVVPQSYSWDFGDGASSSLRNPTHSYASNGTYTVTLTTSTCDLQGVHTSVSDTVLQFCGHTPTVTTTNPWLCEYDTLWTQQADSYQWYAAGMPIPETRRYLANYKQYYSMRYSVLSTVNGCSELSQEFYANPPWSGYYFDAAMGGDPCVGDTALFIAKHINGILPDSALILWYKDATLLNSANNQDTLLITAQGIYEGKVVDTTTRCPFDTIASGPVVFDCGSLRTDHNQIDEGWSIYPNPTSEVLNVEFPKNSGLQVIRIYNVQGNLVQQTPETTSPGEIDVSALPNGLYYIHIRDYRTAKKFIKQ